MLLYFREIKHSLIFVVLEDKIYILSNSDINVCNSAIISSEPTQNKL